MIHRVGGALIPLLGHAHLRRKHFNIFAESGKWRPTSANVTIEAERFVLSEYKNATQIGVDAIGKGDVDDAVQAAKRHGRLGAIARQRPQSFTLASSEKYSDGFAHIGHGRTPGVTLYERVDSNSNGKAACKLGSGGILARAATFSTVFTRR